MTTEEPTIPEQESGKALRPHPREKARADAGGPLSAQEAQLLIHELQAHRIELELQNEKLRWSQMEMSWLATFSQLDPDPIVEADMEGGVHFRNPAAQRLFPDLDMRRTEHPWLSDWDCVVRRFRQGPKATWSREVACAERWYRQSLIWNQDSGRVRVYGTDITEQRRAQQGRESMIAFLRLANRCTGVRDLAQAVAAFFQQHSGCEAVGIRIRDGEDFPYIEARGFRPEFVEAENRLRCQDADGCERRDPEGKSPLRCLCGDVLCGRVDPAAPFFTAQGSFWMNGTSVSDRPARWPDRCSEEGYESVALLPLKVAGERLGLLQLNDRRKGLFLAEDIALWETLAEHAAATFARLRAEEALRQTREALERKVMRRTAELQETDEELHRQIDEKTRAVQGKAQSDLQFQQAQKMEVVGLLAGGIAHDFGNILACIVGNNYFLLEGLKPGHRLRPYSLEIKRSSEVAATLTRQLLGVSGNRGVQQRCVLDPNSVILAMAKMLHRLLGENIHIEQDLHPSVWPVKMDSGQLEQIILNLAINARDAMPQGGRLTLATKNLAIKNSPTMPPPGRYVALEVRDTGTGMDEAVRERIFEPFFTTKGPGRGTGLGLSTVRSIVQESHGHISVESQPGRGSVFRVYLPSVKGGAKAMLRGPIFKKGKHGDETVIVVEDNGNLINILKKTLQEGGYSVISARTAEEALSQCVKIKGRIDVLLTDVVLPGMDGVELAKRLKESWPGLRVIYMSGYPGNALAPIAGFGNCVFLEKPFSPIQLLDTMRQVLDNAQSDLF